MEKVVATQLHAKKVLEKQLSEIEAKQRQSEARRLKQIRDLGVDLSKIHRTTRELDDVINDLSPRYQDQRRGSLPPLDSRSGLSHHQEQSRTPRSRRRLSCIAAIALSPRDDAEYPGTTFSKKGNMATEKSKQLPKIKNDKRESSLLPSVDSADRGENRNEAVVNKVKTKTDSLKSGKRNNNGSLEVNSSCLTEKQGSHKSYGNNSNSSTDESATDINFNGEGRIILSEGGSPYIEDISEAELQSIFADAKRGGRRSSEPELRSSLIRGLHDMSLGETASFQHPNSVGSLGLRNSIQKNLPSDIVAETDEDEPEVLTNKDEVTNSNFNRPSGQGRRVKLSSISESDQDGEQTDDISSPEQNKCEAGSMEVFEDSASNRKYTEKKNFKILRPRRKSDGDVLKLDNTRKFKHDDRSQPGKCGQAGASSAAARMRYNFVNKAEVNRDIWQDMRECRYLRGYDLPEINEPVDVVKFVFGNRNKE